LLLLDDGLLLDHWLLEGLLHHWHRRRADGLCEHHRLSWHKRLHHRLGSNSRLVADNRLLSHDGLMNRRLCVGRLCGGLLCHGVNHGTLLGVYRLLSDGLLLLGVCL
jgi:hypothetical protein